MYATRVVVNTNKENIGSANWRLDWAKLNNKSYAWVASQKIRQSAVTVRNKNVKNIHNRVNGHIHDSSVNHRANTVDRVSETQASHSLPKTTHVNKYVSKVSTENGISTRNRFDVLNSIDNNTGGVLHYTGNVKCVQSSDVSSECKQSNVNVNKNNVAVVLKDASFDSLVLENQSNTQQGNTSKSQNLTTSSKSAVTSGCAGESSFLQSFSLNDKRRRHPSVSGVTDKYDLELRFRPRHRNQIAYAKENCTFTRWNNQTQEKFGFIPLGDLTLPPIDLQKQSKEHIFYIHRRVKVSGTHNYMETQVQIQSQLKPDMWQKYLTNYWDSQLVLLLRYGFPLDFNYSTPLNSVDSNHSSANQYWQDVQAYLDEEKEFGAILGPFQEAPIDNLHVSPFLTRDKPGGAHRRVIVDLSFPHGYSVNAGVQSETYLGTPFLLTLPTIDNITSKVKELGKGCHLYKIDLSRAFRHVKLDPKDYNLLGLRLNGLYIDSCLPFGFKHGSALFQRLSDAVRFIMAQKGFSVTNYIDDIIGHSVISKSNESFQTLRALLLELSFDISEKKVVQPATRVTCLGVDIDTEQFTVSIPPEKITEILKECNSWANREECTKRQLQSLLGKLLYITKCVRISRPFLNRMLDVLRSADKLSKISLTVDFRRDLNWFLEFIPKFNGKAFISHYSISEEIELDASLQGLGARWGTQVYTIPIHLGYENLSIVHLEMLNILVAIRVWGASWSGKAIRIACDNQAVVMVLNSGKTRDLTLAAIARNIFMTAAQFDIFLKTVHIMGVKNEIADSLSRWTISEYFRNKFFNLMPHHTWAKPSNDVLTINWSI